jgi:hypothetical protein
MFNIRLSLLEKFVPRIEDPTLRALVVEMGYSRTAAENALQQCAGDLERAIDFLLQHPPQSSGSDFVWREDVHNQDGAFEVRIVRTGRHLQLVLPQYVPRELEPKLPPRTRKDLVDAQMMWKEQQQSSGCGGGAAAVTAPATPSRRKPSAGSSAAEVPHQSPPSFGHITHQGVVEPKTWQQKLQSFFLDLFIFHLVKNIICSSAEYAASDDEFKTNTILLSSIAFAAQKKWEAVSSAFMFSAPDITFYEFKNVHRIVTSFQIGAQAFRCTAVVFNDGHVVAFPELKNLQKGDPRREPQRKAFYSAIESHFQKNPRVVIDKMLLEPCV